VRTPDQKGLGELREMGASRLEGKTSDISETFCPGRIGTEAFIRLIRCRYETNPPELDGAKIA
jgi:hypothetical protein